MNLSPAGEALIKGFEGLRLIAYQDIRGKWTIGYGHLMSPADPHEISLAQAEAYFLADVAWAVKAVNKVADKIATSQHQFDAMVSFCYNLGTKNFFMSSVQRYHCCGNYNEARLCFLLWNKITVDGKRHFSLGLYRRRAVEAEFYQTPDEEPQEAA